MNYTFYRIKSKNPEIRDCYIGSTKDINKRKITHKSRCNNIMDSDYNIPLYQFIRSNGGFDEFEFEIIDTITFSKTDRFIHEDKLMDLYGSTLNVKRANRSKKEYYAENKEEILKQHKEYYEANKEEISKQKKEYYEANKEEIQEKKQQYYEANKEEIQEKNKKYKEANKEKIKKQTKEYNKLYYEANKDEIIRQKKEYRLKKKQEKNI